MKQLRRILALSHPLLSILVLVVYGAGVLAGGAWPSSAAMLAALFFTLPIALVASGLNDIADRERDQTNPRKQQVYGGAVKASEVRSLFFIISSIVILFVAILAIGGRIYSIAALLTIVFLDYAYSFRPLRLKERPGLDSLANGAGVLAIFLTGYWINTAGFVNAEMPVRIAAAVGLCGIALHAFTTLMDYDIDRKQTLMTIGVRLGKPLTCLLCSILFLACGALVRPPSYRLLCVICAVLCLLGTRYSSPKAYKTLTSLIVFFIPLALVMHYLLRV